jgi:hypothetical protein
VKLGGVSGDSQCDDARQRDGCYFHFALLLALGSRLTCVLCAAVLPNRRANCWLLARSCGTHKRVVANRHACSMKIFLGDFLLQTV